MLFLGQLEAAGVRLDPTELASIVVVVLAFTYIAKEAFKLIREVGLKLISSYEGLNKTIHDGNQIDEKQTQIIDRLDKRIERQTSSLDGYGARLSTLVEIVQATHADILTGQSKIDDMTKDILKQFDVLRGEDTKTREQFVKEIKPLAELLVSLSGGVTELGDTARQFNEQYTTLQSQFASIEPHIVKLVQALYSDVSGNGNHEKQADAGPVKVGDDGKV